MATGDRVGDERRRGWSVGGHARSRSEPAKPHKVRDYLERRDDEFEQKMAEVLCV